MPDHSPEAVQDLQTNSRVLPMPSAAAAVDPHGRAALLLVESLLHALVAKAVVTLSETIDIIDIAADVEAELSFANDEDVQDASLLAPLAGTFRADVGK